MFQELQCLDLVLLEGQQSQHRDLGATFNHFGHRVETSKEYEEAKHGKAAQDGADVEKNRQGRNEKAEEEMETEQGGGTLDYAHLEVCEHGPHELDICEQRHHVQGYGEHLVDVEAEH